jgi:NADPH2:quinone reductase
VRVKACGVNFPDTLIIQNLYQAKPPLPFSPGSDVAGVVKAVGDGVTNYAPGDEVVALIDWGGFAEEAIAPANRVFPKPASMDFETAAAFLMVYGTSYHALKDRARLREGETLLVLGAAGGVGLAAVELGKLMGARVIAAASTAQKLELCREYGADEVINYSEEDLKTRVKALTDGNGADVVYDPVGGDLSEAALRAKGCQVVGVFWGRFATTETAKSLGNTMQLVQWQSEGKISPHIDRVYPLEKTAEALRSLMDRGVRGKVVIKP